MMRIPKMIPMSKATDSKKNIHGILLVNKSEGLTSNALLQKVKHLYKAKKAGHTGSLDPLATGMLPVCFGEATKFSQYLLDADKCYEATGTLGQKTTTADSTGEIIAEISNFIISNEELKCALEQFVGQTKQVPSMFSALKYEGVPLYKLARQGIEIERKARDINVHNLILDKFDGRTFDIKVSCSKGTYIRNLVEDIGDFLQVGAHVSRLHRVYTAGLANEKMYSLSELQQMDEDELNSLLLPIEKPIDYLPKLNLSEDDIRALRQGRIIAKSQLNDENLVRLYDESDLFIGLAEFKGENELAVKRLLAF